MFNIFFILNKLHEKSKTNNVLVGLLKLSDFLCLFAALSPKPICSYWGRKIFKYMSQIHGSIFKNA